MYQEHKQSGKPTFLCPNAADYEHFKQAQCIQSMPEDFPKFKPDEKVVGYYGAISSWLDYDMILKVAEKFKVVLIGSNPFYNIKINHPNVYMLPHKDYKQLPQYLAQFDVAFIPFKLTEMMLGCDPIKFYEYLSSGKPIVTSNVKEIVRNFFDVTYFADINNVKDVIQQAIDEDNDEKRADRIEKAKKNTWTLRVQTAYDMIKQFIR
jgi:glycosyltransferase involved in cell wall biosynthesis